MWEVAILNDSWEEQLKQEVELINLKDEINNILWRVESLLNFSRDNIHTIQREDILIQTKNFIDNLSKNPQVLNKDQIVKNMIFKLILWYNKHINWLYYREN